MSSLRKLFIDDLTWKRKAAVSGVTVAAAVLVFMAIWFATK